MNKIEFCYYLHKTKIDDPKIVEDIFNHGLKSRHGYRLHSTMYKFENDVIERIGLDKIIKNYLGDGEDYNSVFLIKIPRRYFRDIEHRNGKYDPAVPLFREYKEEGVDWNALFTPKLIQGVYLRDIDRYYTNPNFNPVFNPLGCQYSEEQVANFWHTDSMQWVNFDKLRNTYSFEELYIGDLNRHTFDSIVRYYSRLFDTYPSKMVEFKVPKEDKILFDKTR